MRTSLLNSIDKYIKACKSSSWVRDESYKFEFANYIHQKVSWDSLTNEEILEVLLQSQKIKYSAEQRGIQFIIKSGREKLSEFISLADVELFRQFQIEQNIENINWENRSMSYPGLSAWVSSLFPEKLYPVPLIGFNETIRFLFDTDIEKFPKTGLNYLMECQSFMKQTESILKEYPLEEICLKEWNKFYENNSDLGFKNKEKLEKIDWVWLVQDFHLFVYREILDLYKKKSKEVKLEDEESESFVVEGASKLATHLRYERNTSLIKKIKEQALSENKMLNCQICGFSFFERYGEVGEGFIEAHHINPLHESEGETVTKKEDIVLICSNCHRMLHRKENDKYLTIEELKSRMKS